MNRLLPAPAASTSTEGPGFVLSAATRIVAGADPATVAVARRLAESLGRRAGGPLGVGPDQDGAASDGHSAAITLRSDATLTELGLDVGLEPARAEGAFRLVIGPDGVELAAPAGAGLAYGAAALERLAELAEVGEHGRELAAMTVVDRPRFGWRGLSLDVARNFQPVEVITSVLDVLADLRLNVLHLHLSDDQGWRIELPSRPELTTRSGATAVDGATGGYYTVADFAEIVRYAQERHIVVVPELDVPSHINAALHAYGELNPSGEPTEPYTGVEVGFSRLHDDLPATDEFLRDIFADLAEMTPGPYLHLGGDEPLCLDGTEYVRLVDRAIGHVVATGKRVVAWQEGARANLPEGSVVQYWEDRKGPAEVVNAARRGSRVLLSPASRAYFDMKYDETTPLGLDWAGYISVRQSYEWEPLDILPGLSAEKVVGLEAAVWSETIRSAEDLFTLLLPRLAAFAEVAWSEPEQRDWDSFVDRLEPTIRRWQAWGLPYHHPAELP